MQSVRGHSWLKKLFLESSDLLVYSKFDLKEPIVKEKIKQVIFNDEFSSYQYYILEYSWALEMKSKVRSYKANKEVKLRSSLFAKTVEIYGEGNFSTFLNVLKFDFNSPRLLDEFKRYKILILTKEEISKSFLEKGAIKNLFKLEKDTCSIDLGSLMINHLDHSDIMFVFSAGRENALYAIFHQDFSHVES